MYQIEGRKDGGKWPKGPNFGLIVVLFCVAIVAFFLLAYLLLPQFGHFFNPAHSNPR